MSTKITNANQFTAAKNTTGLVVVKCSTSWCGPCKKIAPLYESLPSKYPGVKFYNLDIEQVDFEASAEVQSVPTFLMIKGNWRGKIVGADMASLENAIAANK